MWNIKMHTRLIFVAFVVLCTCKPATSGPCLEHCETCENSGRCVKCVDHYGLDRGGVCLACTTQCPQCLSCSTFTECIECKRNYESDGYGCCKLKTAAASLNGTPTTTTETLPPEVMMPGGSLEFTTQGERNYYGNNVTQRVADLPSGARKSFVDFERPLPAGVLSRFFIYVHNETEANVDSQSRRIRLQIWRPVNGVMLRYTLVWQQLVMIDTFQTGGAYYVYRVNQTIALRAGDRIGWTYEGNYGIISFTYVERYRVYFAEINFTTQGLSSYPEVGQEVAFDPSALSAMFSVAVELNPAPNGSGQSTEPGSCTTLSNCITCEVSTKCDICADGYGIDRNTDGCAVCRTDCHCKSCIYTDHCEVCDSPDYMSSDYDGCCYMSLSTSVDSTANVSELTATIEASLEATTSSTSTSNTSVSSGVVSSATSAASTVASTFRSSSITTSTATTVASTSRSSSSTTSAASTVASISRSSSSTISAASTVASTFRSSSSTTSAASTVVSTGTPTTTTISSTTSGTVASKSSTAKIETATTKSHSTLATSDASAQFDNIITCVLGSLILYAICSALRP